MLGSTVQRSTWIVKSLHDSNWHESQSNQTNCVLHYTVLHSKKKSESKLWTESDLKPTGSRPNKVYWRHSGNESVQIWCRWGWRPKSEYSQLLAVICWKNIFCLLMQPVKLPTHLPSWVGFYNAINDKLNWPCTAHNFRKYMSALKYLFV
jgi:hypothetical protein